VQGEIGNLHGAERHGTKAAGARPQRNVNRCAAPAVPAAAAARRRGARQGGGTLPANCGSGQGPQLGGLHWQRNATGSTLLTTMAAARRAGHSGRRITVAAGRRSSARCARCGMRADRHRWQWWPRRGIAPPLRPSQWLCGAAGQGVLWHDDDGALRALLHNDRV
jgi:hypothetical protein